MLRKVQKRKPESIMATGRVRTQAITQVAHGGPLQAGVIRHHGAGDARRQNVSRTDGQTEPIGCADGGHRGDFRGGALSVGEVVFADFFADGDDDALPADHGAEAECESGGDLHPKRNEAGGAIDVALVVLQDGDVAGSEYPACRISASGGALRWRDTCRCGSCAPGPEERP